MRNLLFAVLIGAFLVVGTASADRGVWLTTGDASYSETGGTAWITFYHLQNPTGGTLTATVTFYGRDYDGSNLANDGKVLGSTTRVLNTNAFWNFHTGAIGNIASTTMVLNTNGVSLITPSTIRGTTSLFYTGTASGFNFWYAD